MKIGLVGEAPSDTLAVKNLLERRYSDINFQFAPLLQFINGSQLDSQKTKRFLRNEYEIQKPDIVIFIRDLDATLPNRTKLAERQDYFINSNSVVDKKGILFLHIFEIEALILADINTFNAIYNTKVEEIENAMSIEEPKEVLKKFTSKYSISHNPEIFKELQYDNLMKCTYFKNFIRKLDKRLL